MLHDNVAFDTPFASDDQVIECGALDLEWGDPETWPDWVDDFRWIAVPDDDQAEPSEDDCRWAAEHLELPPIAGGSPTEPFEPTDADLDDMARWSEWQDRLDSLRREDDAADEARRRFG
jgi:hypothetical protein